MSWPDGEPVTPWADPWHDVMGDIRRVMSGPMTGNPLLDEAAGRQREFWLTDAGGEEDDG